MPVDGRGRAPCAPRGYATEGYPDFLTNFRKKKTRLMLIVTDRCLRLGADAAGGLRRQAAGED